MGYVRYKIPGEGDAPHSPSDQQRKAIFALSVIAHPMRLRIMLGLAQGLRDGRQLRGDLGRMSVADLSRFLQPLLRSGLVRRRLLIGPMAYDLTELGVKTVQFVRETFLVADGSELLPEPADHPIVSRRAPDARPEDATDKIRPSDGQDFDAPLAERSHEPV